MITPDEITEVRFPAARHGLDPTAVASHLATIADAFRALEAELEAAKAQAAANAEIASRDEALRRTLLVAQRTVDQVITEARTEATKIVEEAKAEAVVEANAAREAAEKEAARVEAEVVAAKEHLGTLLSERDAALGRIKETASELLRLAS